MFPEKIILRIISYRHPPRITFRNQTHHKRLHFLLRAVNYSIGSVLERKRCWMRWSKILSCVPICIAYSLKAMPPVIYAVCHQPDRGVFNPTSMSWHITPLAYLLIAGNASCRAFLHTQHQAKLLLYFLSYKLYY